MEPNRVGRVLGVGTRIAAGKLRDGAARASAAAVVATNAAGAAERPNGDSNGVAAASAGRGARPAVEAGGGRRLARGAGRFGAAILRPVAHAGGILWLQISGVFFALFALFFVSHAWETIRRAGWHDRHGEVYAGLAAAFVWFTASSFWRAKRKQNAGGR